MESRRLWFNNAAIQWRCMCLWYWKPVWVLKFGVHGCGRLSRCDKWSCLCDQIYLIQLLSDHRSGHNNFYHRSEHTKMGGGASNATQIPVSRERGLKSAAISVTLAGGVGPLIIDINVGPAEWVRWFLNVRSSSFSVSSLESHTSSGHLRA